VTVRDGSGKTAIHYCSNAEILELLLSRDGSALDTADNSGHTPLHAAVIAGRVNVAQSLLDRGANVNAQDNEQHTAAHWAVGPCQSCCPRGWPQGASKPNYMALVGGLA